MSLAIPSIANRPIQSFRASNDEPSGDLYTRATHVLQEPMEAIEGGIFSVFIIAGVLHVALSVKDYIKARKLPSTHADFERKTWETKKELVLSGVSLTGIVANSMTWGNRVRLINLGCMTPVVGGIGYVASMITSGAKIWESIEEFNNQAQILHSSDSSLSAKNKAFQMQSLNLLRIASYVSTIVWVALGFLALCFGIPVIAAVESTLVITSVVFLVGEMVYRMHLNRQEKELKELAASAR